MQRQFQLLQADYITDLCLVSGSVAVQKNPKQSARLCLTMGISYQI